MFTNKVTSPWWQKLHSLSRLIVLSNFEWLGAFWHNDDDVFIMLDFTSAPAQNAAFFSKIDSHLMHILHGIVVFMCVLFPLSSIYSTTLAYKHI